MADYLKAYEQWTSIAQDLALITIPDSGVSGVDAVCKTYGLTREELKLIAEVPYFRQLFDTSLAELKKLGTRAGTRYRALQLSHQLAESLSRRASSGLLKDSDAIKLLDSLLKMAGLDKEPVQTQVNVQNNIALPFPQGVKKVAHCVNSIER